MAGSSSSQQARAYSYTIGESAPACYRLAQTDTDGAVSYSPAQWVAGAPSVLALYPDPSAGRATLVGAAPGATVRVLDATADAAGEAPLSLPPGLYLVQAPTGTLRLGVQ